MNKSMDEKIKSRLGDLKSIQHDVGKLKKDYAKYKGEVVVKNLKKNNFEAYYVDNKEDARNLLLSLIPDEATIGFGDSHTVFALDLDEPLKGKDCTSIPHVCALNKQAQESDDYGNVKVGNKSEMREVLMRYLVSDVFILSANAITVDGQIVNVDGAGNRVAGSLYGPDRIIVIAGINKLVKDVEAAKDRVGFIAAPINNLKYDAVMPCVKAGVCVNCDHPSRICNITTIIHKRPIDSDFHVIIVGEELGF